jgi:predicted kinase
MGMWSFLTIIVSIGILSEMYQARLKSRAGHADDLFQQISERMARVEERMANIETIVLEKEREKRFDSLVS